MEVLFCKKKHPFLYTGAFRRKTPPETHPLTSRWTLLKGVMLLNCLSFFETFLHLSEHGLCR
ncbi:MAG: hypothetical protein EA344_02970, partial [Alkalicoccus sp.]